MEQVEIDFWPRCDDGSLPATAALYQWASYLAEATADAYKPLVYNTQTRQMLERSGFVNIDEEVIRIPFNAWSSDPHQKQIGNWYMLGLVEYIDALTLAPLTRMKGWRKADVDRLCADAKREIMSKKYHVYCNM
jgi:hypothetical protein